MPAFIICPQERLRNKAISSPKVTHRSWLAKSLNTFFGFIIQHKSTMRLWLYNSTQKHHETNNHHTLQQATGNWHLLLLSSNTYTAIKQSPAHTPPDVLRGGAKPCLPKVSKSQY
jgi:hypothetical protein